MKTKRPVSVAKLQPEAEKATTAHQAEAAASVVHEAPTRLPSETTTATVASRPRSLSVGEQNLSRTPTRTQPVKAAVGTTAATVAVRTPERQATVQRLIMGTEVDARMTTAGIKVDDLDQKPGLQELISTTLKTPTDGASVATFLREVASTPAAQQLPATALSFLYERKASLTGKKGLQDFVVTRLTAGDDNGALGEFMDKLGGTKALDLPSDRLADLYSRRADVLDRPGLKDFVIAKHAANEDIATLGEFLTECKDGPAAGFSSSQLEFLYKQRPNLTDKAGLKEFVVKALSDGEAESDLEGFLAESQGKRVAAFNALQATYLYEHRARVRDQAELKELVISKLASTMDWQPGLDRFLSAIDKLNTDKLTADQFDYLYGLGNDLNKLVSDWPGATQSAQLAALAVGLMSNPDISASQARAEIEDLKAFGYKGALLDFARTKAASRGAEQLKQALAKINAEEAKAKQAAIAQIESDAAPLKPEGPKPSGLSKQDQRKAKNWLTKQEDYDSFKADKLKAEVERLKNIYDPTRAALKRDQDAAFVAPELQKYKKFVSDAGFHADAEWALRTADGDTDLAKILFDACKDQAELKKFGAWAAKSGFGGQKLQAVLKAAADLKLDANKAQAVAPYLADCPDPATRQWLETRAPTTSAEDLTFEVGLLKQHTTKTLSVARSAIDAAPGKPVLTKYNRLLAKPDLGVELLRLIQDKSIASLVVAKIVDVYGDRGNDLKDFLRATNPLPAGYTSLQEICALVKTDPQGKMGNAIDNVTFAITEAVPRNVGQPYIAHILKRLGEGRTKAQIKDHDIGYMEWLLVSGKQWTDVQASNSPYKAVGQPPNSWTGIFKMKVDGVAIEVHNHFIQGGAQYSLHIKFGAGSFDRGPELGPKTDASVYASISKGCLDEYTTWVHGRWALYTVPK